MKQEVSVILSGLAEAVVAMDEDRAAYLSKKAVDSGIDAYLAISKGLARGMEIMSEGYQKGIYFVPELLLASDAMNAGMSVLKPHISEDNSSTRVTHTVVIGVTEGDTHDIGKNLVKTMMEASGFRIIDLGRDVPIRRFVDTAAHEKADIICLSSLMSTTMLRMGDIIKLLTEEGIRERFKVMVGGACVSPAFASQIGADGYAPNASTAVVKAKALLKPENNG
jgi:dimethylamine corrinoid protein